MSYAFGAGMREATHKIANTFRTLADKPTVDYSQREQKFSKTKIVKKLLEAVEVPFFLYMDFCSAKDKHKCYTVKGSFVW
jgi:hypothetical protein